MKVWRMVRATGLLGLSLFLLVLFGLSLVVANSFGIIRALWWDFYSQEDRDA